MTLPLRRKHLITAPNIHRKARSTSLRWWASRRRCLADWCKEITLFGSAYFSLIGIATFSANAEQYPQQPISGPREQANRTIPVREWQVTTRSAQLRFINSPREPATSASSKTGWRLKGRESQVATGHSDDRPVSSSIRRESKVSQVSYDEEVDGGPTLVRPAQNVATDDPFSDPFGDKGSKPSAEEVPANQPRPALKGPSSSIKAPMPGEPPRSLFEEEPNSRPVPPSSLDESLGESPMVDSPPTPPSGVLPGQEPPLLDQSGDLQMPCDRIYHERNCCSEDARCLMVRKTLKSGPIRDISLDITPSFKPDAKSRDEIEQSKATTLASAPSRTWKNRAGEAVAIGRLRDLKHTRAVVETEDGETKQLSLSNLSDDDRCFVAAWWGIPTECLLADEGAPRRDWIPTELDWKASALCHKPLYFEEVQLERYGHTTGPWTESIVSGAHFFLNVAFLPYKMGINPPGECQYALGYYRPGSCAPWLVPPTPVSLRGALFEAGVITGGVFVIP